MFVAKKLTTSWGKQNYIYDFNLKKNQFAAVVGPSGGGKSTLLSLIAGLLPIYGGQLIFDHIDITKKKPQDRPVSLLFQNHNLFEHLTIWQNMALGLRADLKLSDQEKDKVQSLAEELKIASYFQRKPYELSGGQRQRVAIGRTLLRKQPILLLDEPFSALDKALRVELLGLIEDVHHKNDFITLMVSHHPDELTHMADCFIQIDPPLSL